MMLFTSGYPNAGKTEFIKKIMDVIGDNIEVYHVDPKSYYPDNYNILSKKLQSEVAISSWELSFEKVDELIKKYGNNVLVVFDTCLSKVDPVRQLFVESKLRKHIVVLAYVNASPENRFNRADDKNELEFCKSLENIYKTNFLKNLTHMKDLSDHFIVIDNNLPINRLEENDKFIYLVNLIKKIREV